MGLHVYKMEKNLVEWTKSTYDILTYANKNFKAFEQVASWNDEDAVVSTIMQMTGGRNYPANKCFPLTKASLTGIISSIESEWHSPGDATVFKKIKNTTNFNKYMLFCVNA